jgi:hypothetical protein
MKDTGGRAFPHSYEVMPDKETHIHHGMTLRDWFAGRAMQTVMNDARIPGVDADPLPPEAAEVLAAVAKVSYRVADAMLAERIKE